MSPSSFPPAVPCTGAALSSAGSRGKVPLHRRSYRGTPTPSSSSAPPFLDSGVRTYLSAGSHGASQVPGDPLCVRALLSDPGGTSVPGRCAQSRYSTSMLPHTNGTAAAPTTIFRGSITRHIHSLSTLRSQGHPWTTQDSLPGGGQPSPGGRREAHVHWDPT